METTKERLEYYLKCSKVSKSQFGRTIGVSNAYVSSMRQSIQPDKLEKIKESYPDLNIDWLLTGDGEMIVTQNQTQTIALRSDVSGVPVYNIDATCGVDPRDFDFTDEMVIGSIDLPNVRRDCKIIRANGDSMTPVINDGNWIAVREVYDFNDVFYGQIYLVITDEYRMIKYVRRCIEDEQNCVVLRSENMNYDDIRMKKSKIKKMFIVESILAVKIQL